MPRVLMAVEPPEGGTPEVVAALARGLPSLGWDVEVAAPAGAPRLGGLEAPLHPVPFAGGYGSPGADARSLAALARLLRSGRFDLVHTHSAKAGVLARPLAAAVRVPAVHSPHCFPFLTLQYSARRRALAARVERALGRVTRAIVCVCEDERREALARRIAPPDRLAVVHNGVPSCPAVEPDHRLSALRRGGPLTVMVTALREQKRVDVGLEAARLLLDRMPAARFAVVGNGPLRPALEAQAHRLGLDADERFALLPFEGPSARYLRAADVAVLSSDYEAFPIGVLEAMACGVPVVATAVGGTSEAVSDATGRLVAPGDPAALAAAVATLLADPGALQALGRTARAVQAERFTGERMVRRTADVYAAVLARA